MKRREPIALKPGDKVIAWSGGKEGFHRHLAVVVTRVSANKFQGETVESAEKVTGLERTQAWTLQEFESKFPDDFYKLYPHLRPQPEPEEIPEHDYQVGDRRGDLLGICLNLKPWICAQEWALGFLWLCSDQDVLNSLELPKLTNSVAASSASDIPESTTTEISKNSLNPSETEIFQSQQEVSTYLPVRRLANPSPSEENDSEQATQETVSPQSSTSSENCDANSSASKTSPASSVAPKETTTKTQGATSAGLEGIWPPAGMMSNGKLYHQPTLEPPGIGSDSLLLASPTALSSTGKGNPPGSTALEDSLRGMGAIGPKEVCNPEFLEAGSGIPVGWTNPQDERSALEFLQEMESSEVAEKPLATRSIRGWVSLDSVELSNSVQELKALSLWQPWASLIATINPETEKPFKQFETRGENMKTNYRGKLIIHAAKTNDASIRAVCETICEDLDLDLSFDDLPRGCAIAICDLVDCIQMTEEFIDEQSTEEIICGDWQVGRYAWKLENVQVFNPPIPMKGQQGLWNVDPEFLKGVSCFEPVAPKKKPPIILYSTDNKLEHDYKVGDRVLFTECEGEIFSIDKILPSSIRILDNACFTGHWIKDLSQIKRYIREDEETKTTEFGRFSDSSIVPHEPEATEVEVEVMEAEPTKDDFYSQLDSADDLTLRRFATGIHAKLKTLLETNREIAQIVEEAQEYCWKLDKKFSRKKGETFKHWVSVEFKRAGQKINAAISELRKIKRVNSVFEQYQLPEEVMERFTSQEALVLLASDNYVAAREEAIDLARCGKEIDYTKARELIAVNETSHNPSKKRTAKVKVPALLPERFSGEVTLAGKQGRIYTPEEIEEEVENRLGQAVKDYLQNPENQSWLKEKLEIELNEQAVEKVESAVNIQQELKKLKEEVGQLKRDNSNLYAQNLKLEASELAKEVERLKKEKESLNKLYVEGREAAFKGGEFTSGAVRVIGKIFEGQKELTMQNFLQQVEEQDQENRRLLAENAQLKARLAELEQHQFAT